MELVENSCALNCVDSKVATDSGYYCVSEITNCKTYKDEPDASK